MKTQLSKPARDRAKYSEDYKKEALELWRNSGRSAAKVAAQLGIRAPLLYRWARPNAKPIIAHMSPSQGAAWKSSKRRSVDCVLRTPSFWSNAKF